MKTGLRAYLMYMNTPGATWKHVAEELGITESGAVTVARKYARTHDKQWPPLSVGDPRRLDKRKFKGKLEKGDMVTIKKAEGVFIAPWYETLDKWDVLL